MGKQQVMTYIAKLMIYFYKFCISPLLPNACRFLPTCSDYALEAIKKYGAFKGGYLTLKRLIRCHPFYKGDMHDPLP